MACDLITELQTTTQTVVVALRPDSVLYLPHFNELVKIISRFFAVEHTYEPAKHRVAKWNREHCQWQGIASGWGDGGVSEDVGNKT